MSYTLDPLLLRAASPAGTSGDTAVAVLASLLGIDAESAEGEQLRAMLIDSGSMGAMRSSRSAAALMQAPRGSGADADLAAQRDQEWRVALAGSAAMRPGAGTDG